MGMVKSQKVFVKSSCPKRLSVEISYGLVRFIAVNREADAGYGGTLAPDSTQQPGIEKVQAAITVTVSPATRPEVRPREIVVKL